MNILRETLHSALRRGFALIFKLDLYSLMPHVDDIVDGGGEIKPGLLDRKFCSFPISGNAEVHLS